MAHAMVNPELTSVLENRLGRHGESYGEPSRTPSDADQPVQLPEQKDEREHDYDHQHKVYELHPIVIQNQAAKSAAGAPLGRARAYAVCMKAA